MEMDMLPLSILLMPNASLLDGSRCGHTRSIGGLRQANVTDDRRVTHHTHLRARQSRLHFAP